jgi:hypothetical protein
MCIHGFVSRTDIMPSFQVQKRWTLPHTLSTNHETQLDRYTMLYSFLLKKLPNPLVYQNSYNHCASRYNAIQSHYAKRLNIHYHDPDSISFTTQATFVVLIPRSSSARFNPPATCFLRLAVALSVSMFSSIMSLMRASSLPDPATPSGE